MNSISEPADYLSWFPWSGGNFPGVALWLVAGFVILLICSIFFESLRRGLLRLLQVGLILLLLCGAFAGAYLVCFDRCDNLVHYDDGRNVRLLGVCRDVRVSIAGEAKRASFVLRTPTGKMKVVTRAAAPAEGSVIYIRGRKGTFDARKTFVESDYQCSAF